MDVFCLSMEGATVEILLALGAVMDLASGVLRSVMKLFPLSSSEGFLF